MSEEGALAQLRRLILGRPIPSHLAHHERLSRVTGLAVLSSDALSSVAYATEEILRVLMVAGAAALAYASPISLLIAALLATVAFSYRQTIYAYPSGGGAYIVARENLGQTAGLVAAAALLIDYTLTVSVSVAAGVSALTSALPALHDHRVSLAIAFIAILMIGNLRGIRESGNIFSVPTYFFIVMILGLIAVGLFRYVTRGIEPLPASEPLQTAGAGAITTFALLRAFSNGCTAMTGVEAVSNGVAAFRPPEAKNAATTLIIMAMLAITMFVGITLLAHAYEIIPSERETVVSQLARGIFNGRGLMYYLVQGATMLILVLAANTAYADFPRLASIVARDKYLPRQFMNQGDRLAFSNGIVSLSVFAALLIVIFAGDTHALIPLYMIGVFISFTLSQTGMVVRAKRGGERGWLAHAAINLIGALLTGTVLVIVATTKASEGAWIILLLIPCLVFLFVETKKHYDHVASQLSLTGGASPARRRNVVLVPIGGIQRAVIEALEYADSLSEDVRAIYVDLDPAATGTLRRDWEKWGKNIPLIVLDSPYRSLMEPLLEYIEQISAGAPNDYVTVVLPEFVPARWWHHLLHNQRALLIKAALLFKPNTVVTSVPFHLRR
ncbi:MAG: APC family permease [Vicinamibacterales bacterium]